VELAGDRSTSRSGAWTFGGSPANGAASAVVGEGETPRSWVRWRPTRCAKTAGFMKLTSTSGQGCLAG
jgi:hypothetical protein